MGNCCTFAPEISFQRIFTESIVHCVHPYKLELLPNTEISVYCAVHAVYKIMAYVCVSSFSTHSRPTAKSLVLTSNYWNFEMLVQLNSCKGEVELV